jgi:hypothetical protein
VPLRAQNKAALAPSTGRIAKKKVKGFRMKKNGARPRPLHVPLRRAERTHALTLVPACTPHICAPTNKHTVMVKGIKIVNADTKNEALQRLKADQAMAMLEG